MINGALAGRKAVDPAPKVLDLTSELACSPFGRAAEEDVFQEMGQAGFFRRLIRSAGPDPQLKGRERR